MGLIAWLRGKSHNDDPRLAEWRRNWALALERPDPAAVASLAARLAALGLPDDDIEVQREMLDALRELVRFRTGLEASGLPVVQTGHRVIGTDTCHFSAPASMPDEEGQPAGRLLLTGTRAVFAGGGRTKALPWHSVGKVVSADRDIVVFRKGQDSVHRFRCNTFADALCGVDIAQRLADARPRGDAASVPAAAARRATDNRRS